MNIGTKVKRLFARPEPARCVGGCLDPVFDREEIEDEGALLWRAGAWWHWKCWERECEEHGDQIT